MNEQTNPSSAPPDASSATRTRQMSKIAFPYDALADAEAIAEKIHANVGNGSCTAAQIAAWTNQSSKSSGFRTQIAAGRLFGLIESEGAGYRLTALGRRWADPQSKRKAKVDAFLSVPLFAALFKAHSEGVLPPTAALEREIASLGVADKQKARARQVFERSAEQAGFFESGKNRLVLPAIKEGDVLPSDPGAGAGGGGGNGEGGGPGNGGGDDDLKLDALLMALLRKIPAADEGWPQEKRLRWFKTFAMNVSQVYDADDKPVELTINVEDRSN